MSRSANSVYGWRPQQWTCPRWSNMTLLEFASQLHNTSVLYAHVARCTLGSVTTSVTCLGNILIFHSKTHSRLDWTLKIRHQQIKKRIIPDNDRTNSDERPLCTKALSTWPDALSCEFSKRHIKVIKNFNSAHYVSSFGLPPDCESYRP